MIRKMLVLFAAGVATLILAPRAGAAENLAHARKLYLTGKYAEAQELYALLAEKKPEAAALGKARCQVAVGKNDDAEQTLTAAAANHADDAKLRAALARLEFKRGKYDAAKQWTDAALAIDKNQPAARWMAAELLRVFGKLAEADKAYEWLLDYYNRTDIEDPDAVRDVGKAAAQFARWNQKHDDFSTLVNDLFPAALEMDKNYWPALLESGLLFLEKFNEPDAVKDFQAALKINPNAAEVHAALATLALQNYQLEKALAGIDRALEINPNLLSARQLKADVEFANFEPARAAKILEAALPLDPVSEKTLGRLAASYGCVDGLHKDLAGSRLEKITKEVTARNPKPGPFYEALGDSLDTMRRYPQAARYYNKAVEVMPQLVAVPGKLGLVHMRLGDEKKARQVLAKAFEIDFGNVRVKNSLEVLDVLDTYETLETAHFLIRFDPKHDKILARYVGRYLEEVYGPLCKQLDYEPKEKSLFEIFNKAKNTGGHGWFSARMVGLPHVHTIGACAGKMVAMVSPSAMPQGFNWARVVKHEFVHVVNLQQTNFTIPHWYTEALAVYNEGYPRPDEWNAMLRRRVPAGKVFNLESINLGFIRPTSSEDWQMAYCQAEMYAEYMLQRFGEDALSKVLAGYADNLGTPDAIKRAFNVDVEDFERGYSAYVRKVVDGLPTRPESESKPLAKLIKQVEQNPKDADLLAELALAYLARKAYPKAGELATRALAIKPKHQAATYVKARLQIVIGNAPGALSQLEDVLDREAPHPRTLQLLAGLKYKAGDYEEAAELYDLGRKKFAGDTKWVKLLARVYLKAKDDKRLAPVLVELATADGDSLTTRKKLAQLALARDDYKAAAKWATESLHINILDADVHRMLGEANAGQKKFPPAIDEYEVAVELKPRAAHLRFALADTCVQAGQEEKARGVLKELLKIDPDYPGADVLLESLNKDK